jgi:hypothetical protein
VMITPLHRSFRPVCATAGFACMQSRCNTADKVEPSEATVQAGKGEVSDRWFAYLHDSLPGRHTCRVFRLTHKTPGQGIRGSRLICVQEWNDRRPPNA